MTTQIETAHGTLSVPPQYTHLATVRGCLDVPVRKEGGAWWCMFEVDLGRVWGRNDVTHIRPIDADDPATSQRCPKCDRVRARLTARAEGDRGWAPEEDGQQADPGRETRERTDV